MVFLQSLGYISHYTFLEKVIFVSNNLFFNKSCDPYIENIPKLKNYTSYQKNKKSLAHIILFKMLTKFELSTLNIKGAILF